MAERGTVAWRVDFQTLRPEALKEHTGRKATTCKVTLSCGARIGEGHFMSVAILVSMFGDEASQS